ncbi:MAG: hypothetical protein ACI9UV_002501 [Algoriphagus sp.]|jgi:hypothetical protein
MNAVLWGREMVTLNLMRLGTAFVSYRHHKKFRLVTHRLELNFKAIEL